MAQEFGTAINCMDGRVQEPVIDWLKNEFDVEYVDMITEPGPNRVLGDKTDHNLIDSIKERVDISVNKHGSNIVAIVGHYDCAGNDNKKEGQLSDIKKALKKLEEWNLDAELIGLWVNHNWEVEKI